MTIDFIIKIRDSITCTLQTSIFVMISPHFESKKQISCSLQLTNRSDDHVAFKVKTTSPKKYCVRPNAGIILPRSTCDVIVTMQTQREAPPDIQCEDRFLVQGVVLDEGFTANDITQEMFAQESGNVVDERKLLVAHVSHHLNHPLRFSRSLRRATRAYAEDIQQERSSENLALISRLTEEKNAAIQQNNKLRQELVVQQL
uniref:MSP domain-containing protein n=1 Tax=Musa acuminata subsp. malaccensis TaxID=214687 RepID=A0A804L8E5_MUSAM